MQNILYLAHRIPYPPNKGDKIRSYNEIKYLSKHYKIDLICLADDPNDIKYKKDLEKICSKVEIFSLNTITGKIIGFYSLMKGFSISEKYFYKKFFQKLFNQWTVEKKYKAIICFSSPMAEYIFKSSNYKNLKSSSKLIMDFCDLDSDKWDQYSEKTKFPLAYIYRKEGERLLKYEKKIHKIFNSSIFISQAEADLFKKYIPDPKNLSVIPNGVDFKYFSSVQKQKEQNFKINSSSKEINLMFAGAMDYYANVDGVIWFCDKILPAIKVKYPELIFNIVGSNPDKKVKILSNDKSVNVTGFVDDIRTYYNNADICVIPLRIARGVQNKVLEAMSMGKPVITTQIAIQGITVEDKKQSIVANTPEEFINAIINLINNPDKRKKLGNNARKHVESEYSWAKNMKKFIELIN